MRTISFGWLLRRPKLWSHLHHVPMRQLSILLSAIFLLFSVIGFYVDLMHGGTQPYAIVLASAAYSGFNAVIWVLIVSRLPSFFIFLMTAKEIFLPVSTWFLAWVQASLHPLPVSHEDGVHFAATSIMLTVIASYVCFSAYLGIAGREAFRLKTELALAHSIQKTLVPPIDQKTRCFEVYGVSKPSEKVGGDLVDVVLLSDGDAVAYLADIAGHGLQAGILMGMLKTAARTALADGSDAKDGAVLSQLMLRINQVLPQVKEAHMYATLTALRLTAEGQVFYGMAASPPLLHWSAAQKSVTRYEEEQFPLGLLPVAEFPSSTLAVQPEDLLLVATDGILEVTGEAKASRGLEFGTEALEKLIADHADRPLSELAAAILKAVRKYGKQFDDQTLLLVRRTQ